MQRLSTNMTLFFRFFLPIMWIVILGSTTIAIWFAGQDVLGGIGTPEVRWGALVFYLSGVALLGLTLMRLKRVESDQEYLVVTNYFKTVRYPWRDVDKIKERKVLFLELVTIELKAPGRFGRRLHFLASKKLYAGFKLEMEQLLGNLWA